MCVVRLHEYRLQILSWVRLWKKGARMERTRGDRYIEYMFTCLRKCVHIYRGWYTHIHIRLVAVLANRHEHTKTKYSVTCCGNQVIIHTHTHTHT
jgi:hypothetical protein